MWEHADMDHRQLLTDLFDRVAEHVHDCVEGLDADRLIATPLPGANPIGWLVWHLARVQDSHVAELLDEEQIWVTGDWGHRFGIASDPSNTGYGHSEQDVRALRPDGADALLRYYDDVAARTHELLQRVTTDELDRVVDERWDPPVTMGVRLISIADDDIQHAGQAAYARGMLEQR